MEVPGDADAPLVFLDIDGVICCNPHRQLEANKLAELRQKFKFARTMACGPSVANVRRQTAITARETQVVHTTEPVLAPDPDGDPERPGDHLVPTGEERVVEREVVVPRKEERIDVEVAEALVRAVRS